MNYSTKMTRTKQKTKPEPASLTEGNISNSNIDQAAMDLNGTWIAINVALEANSNAISQLSYNIQELTKRTASVGETVNKLSCGNRETKKQVETMQGEVTEIMQQGELLSDQMAVLEMQWSPF